MDPEAAQEELDSKLPQMADKLTSAATTISDCLDMLNGSEQFGDADMNALLKAAEDVSTAADIMNRVIDLQDGLVQWKSRGGF